MKTEYLQPLFIQGMSSSMLHVIRCHFLKIFQICVQVEHAFATLKGHFQSLQELWLRMRT